MTKHCPQNERIKRDYFIFLKEAKRQSESTVDACAKAVDRFEVYNRHRDFRQFHRAQAVGFKKHLAEQTGQRTGEKLSKATLYSTMTQLKRFFEWLAMQPGYKSHVQYSDAEYFSVSDKDARIATARREQIAPTLEQVRNVIQKMPANNEIERRNRALIAFTILTGARDGAIASMKLKHVDLIENSVSQDAREVQTKFSKTFNTFFFPVGDEIRSIVADWVSYLREEKLLGNEDPLFPATLVALGPTRQFEVSGLGRCHWKNASPIRKIFREAFTAADLPYFNPHSFRNTLVQLMLKICKSAEEVKAWSQNLGHEGVMTTFVSYGQVPCDRQGEIILGLSGPEKAVQTDVRALAKAFFQELRNSGVDLRVK
jgi:integrase